MEFKVGDKVRLKKEYKSLLLSAINKDYIRKMLSYTDVFTIKEIDETDMKSLKIEEDKFLWYYTHWFEKVEEEPKPVFDDIKLVYCGDKTVAIYGSNLGESVRSEHDKEDRKIGILIATMRALGFGKSTVNKVVDVLFDDFTTIEELTNEELLEEVQKRMK